jgi:hypothetical protein
MYARTAGTYVAALDRSTTQLFLTTTIANGKKTAADPVIERSAREASRRLLSAFIFCDGGEDLISSNYTAMWQKTRTILGCALLALGVAGVLLPIVPGTPLLLAAVALLGPENPLIRRMAQYVRRMIKQGNHASNETRHEIPD